MEWRTKGGSMTDGKTVKGTNDEMWKRKRTERWIEKSNVEEVQQQDGATTRRKIAVHTNGEEMVEHCYWVWAGKSVTAS